MELQHFSHDHPLILNEEQKNDAEEVCCCNGCLEQISGPSYNCNQCDFSLHKLCAELPTEMEHPMHPDHPLTLLTNPLFLRCICDVCQGDWKSFTYRCFQCDFDIDIICASLMERKIEHKSHKHPLTPMRRPALLFCSACGTKHEGIFYFCTSCGHFWIHRDCASLPSTVKHSDHDHSLTLAYSIPIEYSNFTSYCDICAKELNRFCWVFYCAECRYFAHVNCATSKTEPFMSILLPCRKTEIKVEDFDANLIHLPVPNEFVSLTSHCFKEMSMGKNQRATELNHFSHDHPLILFDVQSSDESCSTSKLSSPNETKNDNICDGCTQPILGPFYRCIECNFFLHEWCVELPTELQHPFHPQHPLILLAKSPMSFGLFLCNGCGFFSNRFTFTCACCHFHLDVTCGSLPTTIRHEAHLHHRLVLKEKLDGRCNACQMQSSGFAFGCGTCDFKLDLRCARLPSTIRHRYDEHLLILNYSPLKNYPDVYYCEVCEEELNPKCWFYHCDDCDQSFHYECIRPVDECSNIKIGGKSYQVKGRLSM
ncbi:hypothetical protein F0562_015652 [Nyssa sinensis]|uniref:Phorbol-ester/DAG-type domain-containing protein n=1 Tax=Nyssa sinensis TaxID=561372 RepID=A0A5J4ZKS5_9ASTE|nr:hypothetical protein F0562_015652 [Nyssa sinensis]